jgi:hypothetical protein
MLKFGGFSIFFNPTKPGGSFTSRFYLLCCSSSYACVRIRMHTKTCVIPQMATKLLLHGYIHIQSPTTTTPWAEDDWFRPGWSGGKKWLWNTFWRTRTTGWRGSKNKLTLVLDMCSSLWYRSSREHGQLLH